MKGKLRFENRHQRTTTNPISNLGPYCRGDGCTLQEHIHTYYVRYNFVFEKFLLKTEPNHNGSCGDIQKFHVPIFLPFSLYGTPTDIRSLNFEQKTHVRSHMRNPPFIKIFQNFNLFWDFSVFLTLIR